MSRNPLLLLPWVLFLAGGVAPGRTAEPDKPPVPEQPEVLPGKLTLTLNCGGHTAQISKVLFTPDSKFLISGSVDRCLRIWNLDTFQTERVLYPPGGGRGDFFTLSPNGRRLAVACTYRAAKEVTHFVALVGFADGQIQRVLKSPAQVVSLAFSPDGKRLAASATDNTIRIWSLAGDESEPVSEIKSPLIDELVFSPDGSRLACRREANPGRAGIIDVDTGKEGVPLPGNAKPEHAHITGVAWSPDGHHVATSGDDGVRLWGPNGKLRKHDLKPFSTGPVSFSADSHWLLVTQLYRSAGNRTPLALAFDVRTGASFQGNTTVEFDDPKTHLWPGLGAKPPGQGNGVFSRNGKLVATGAEHGINEILLWNPNGALVKRLGARRWLPDDVQAAGWSPDGRLVSWRKLDKASDWKGPTTFRLNNLRLGAPVDHARIQGAVLQHYPFDLRGVGDRAVHLDRPPRGLTPKVLTLPGGVLEGAMTFAGRAIADRKQTLLAAVAHTGNAVAVFDVNGLKHLRDLRHHGRVVSLAPSPEGRYLLSLSIDQKLRIWDPERPRPLLTLYVSGQEWIAWTPQGYYAASPEGERLMGWVVENGPDEMCTFHPASRFRARLYRPDVIKLLLQEGSLAAALKKADAARGQATRQVNVSQVLPPQVKITTSAQPGAAIKDGKLKIDAEARPLGADPITALQLLIDDRPYATDQGLVTFDKPQMGPVKASWEVKLPPGPHDIRVLARTEASLGTSRGMSLLAASDEPEGKKELPALYVLAVGIDAYPKPLTLGGAVNDARELEQVFQKYSTSLFRKVEANVVLDKDATREGMRKGLDWLKKNMTANDVAVFFYAGHGDRDKKGGFYLLPQDVDLADLEKTGLSRAEIKKRMQGLPGRVVVILDACHSGAIGLLIDDLSRELPDEDCGVVVMCAARPSQAAMEKQGHGYFTRSVIEGLSGKASTSKRDNCVYLHHLQQYVIDNVVELSKDKQHPVVVVPPWMRPLSLSKP